MGNDAPKCNEVGELLARLSEAGARVDKDDLSLLAKMHGWCESLGEAAGPESAAPLPEVCAAALELTKQLEAIILAEVEDPAATMVEAKATVGKLAEAFGGAPGSLSSGEGAVGEALAAEPAAGAPGAGLTPQDDLAATAGQTATKTPVETLAETPGEPTAPAQFDAGSAEPAYEQLPLEIDEKELEFVGGFVDEAREHIEAIEAALLEVERAPDDAEQIDSLFRPFHTIKGMAGFLNLRDINCVTHEAETLLDQARKGKRTITPGLIDLIFEVVDILKAQLSAVAAYVSVPNGEVVPQPPVVEMIGHLRAVVAGKIEPQTREAGQGSGAQKLGENLVEQGVVAQEVVDFAVSQQQSGKTGKKTGQLLVGMGTASAKQVSKALRPQTEAQNAPAPGTSAPVEQSIRIDTDKLDALVDMVGELVIAQTLVNSSPRIASEAKLVKDVSQVTKIVRDVQELAMAMRMVPIGGTFTKMARLVRDVSRKANKRVELSISGEDTELDKNVTQQINDPLVHMVRNAIDHGVESPEVRRAAGKDEVGHVHLSAFHHAGNIVIEISDDGKGLDPEVLHAKGIEKGIISPDDELTEQQIFHLIFAPGFSTAAQVTDISGRGVGMDVVKRNLEALRGKVEITSEKGKGSTFSIRLPLTLAIIDGMVVRVGDERFIIPTIAIEQSLQPRPEQITTVQNRGEVLNVRGRLVPLVQLGSLFGLSRRRDPCEAMVVIASSDAGAVGLVLDELIGQQQVVIKSLGERFEGLRGISGAAILGDGRVGLILELTGIEAAHRSMSLPLITEEAPPLASDLEVESAAPPVPLEAEVEQMEETAVAVAVVS